MPLAATLIAALGERAGEGSAEKAVDEPTVAAARRQMEAEVFMVVACFAGGGEESEESERFYGQNAMVGWWESLRFLAESSHGEIQIAGEVFVSVSFSCVACPNDDGPNGTSVGSYCRRSRSGCGRHSRRHPCSQGIHGQDAWGSVQHE